MKSTSVPSAVVCVVTFILSALFFTPSAQAVGVLYSDPGWTYAYDGNEAFYNDLDGPNPDYINGDPNNKPGGQGGNPILVDPRFLDPNCDPLVEGDCANAEWLSKASQWDGSAPGDPLGGVPTGLPPLIPPAPGGVQTYTDSGTTYLRVQDPGQPQSYGWTDKNAAAGPTSPLQEGNNRKIQFHHPLVVDDPNVDPAVLDNGITISFRARIATTATGPLDDIFPEGGTTLASTSPWPTDGIGYAVVNDGRGMFHLTQDGGAGGPQQMAFSLLDTNAVPLNVDPNSTITKTGLVMNNRANPAVVNDVDTNMSNDTTLNIVEIPNDPNSGASTLTDWHEFWITIQALPSPVDGNTHEVNVFHDGEVTTPQTFQIVLSNQNEFNTGAHLGMGLSSGTAQGAYDIDFFAYSLGILAPTLGCGDGDFDCNGVVDGDDFLLWQQGGSPGGGTQAELVLWETNYGAVFPLSAATAAVPEPSGFLLMIAASTLLCSKYRAR